MKPILLLTASIDPQVSDTPMTFITKPEIRLAQYRQTLDQMMLSHCFGKIIFCENTNYEVDFQKEMELAERNGVQFEHLKFEGNYAKIHEQGKGYGEGEIIAYALSNSKLIEKEDHFYKLTGRIQLDNIQKLIPANFKIQVFLRNRADENSVDTRFFCCTTDFYRKNLLNTYTEVNDLEGQYLEKVFFKALKPLASQIPNFPVYPKYSGFAGSTGQSYHMSPLKYWWYQFLFKRGKLSI